MKCCICGQSINPKRDNHEWHRDTAGKKRAACSKCKGERFGAFIDALPPHLLNREGRNA